MSSNGRRVTLYDPFVVCMIVLLYHWHMTRRGILFHEMLIEPKAECCGIGDLGIRGQHSYGCGRIGMKRDP